MRGAAIAIQTAPHAHQLELLRGARNTLRATFCAWADAAPPAHVSRCAAIAPAVCYAVQVHRYLLFNTSSIPCKTQDSRLKTRD